MSTPSITELTPKATGPVAPSSPAEPLAGSTALGLRDRMARKATLGRLRKIERGVLHVREGDLQHRMGHEDADGLQAVLHVQDTRFWGALAGGGSLGAADAYMRGWWRAESLTDLVRLMVRNQGALEGIEAGLAKLTLPLRRLRHARNANTRSGSKRNISAHYDLSNDFFALFLDDTMTYSCGIFERESSTLREASLAKIDRLCRKLRLSPLDHLVEIGTGWGAFAVRAAQEFGCRVTTTTISREQYDLAMQRVRSAGLEGQVRVLLTDYRDLQGTYDKLVSVEMIEAVGHQFYPEFFRTCARLLKPQGLMALQAITIADQHYERAKYEVDFIQRYVFPGSCIPSVTALLGAATRGSDLKLTHMEDITPHYVRTLAAWRERFFARLDDVRALGYDEAFVRMWDYYLSYCEGGFAERHIGNVQMVLSRPRDQSAPLLASLGNPPQA